MASISGLLRGVSRPIQSFVLASVLVAALVGGPNLAANGVHHAAAASTESTLVIVNEGGGPWTCCGLYTGDRGGESLGPIYETLAFVNTINGKITPWLATAYKWSSDSKMLTFTIRQGVKWSDGQPFTPADVVFTFSMLKKYPAMDLQSAWSALKSVVQQGNQVVFTFKQSAVPWFYYIAGLEGIVPQHIWSKIADPVTYADKTPVGTGPFLLSSQTTPMNLVYVRNPHYWQPGLPKVDKILYPAFLNNQAANLYLAQGKADWGGQFIPNVDSYFVAKDKAHNHYWYPPHVFGDLFINQTDPILKDKAVRQALAYGIDRVKISQLAEYGYEPPGNQSGILLPNFKDWYDSGLAAKYNYTFNPQKAQSILTAAGYKKNGSGIFETPQGKPLAFDCVTVAGNTDWLASVQVASQELKQSGIQLNVVGISNTDFNDRARRGNFQILYNGDNGGPNPYYTFKNILFSGNSAPIGQTASSNYERYSNPAADKLLLQFAATTDSAAQHAIINKLQAIYLEDVPVIPVSEGVSWYQWSTRNFTGWPTSANPYAAPAPYNTPDFGVVLLNLRPV